MAFFFNIENFNTYACAHFLHFYQNILVTHMLSTHPQCEIPQFTNTYANKHQQTYEYPKTTTMRYHDLPDWTGTVRNEPILSKTDIDCDNIKAINNTKLIMCHHILECEEFYVHNNIVIYLERMKTVPDELLHPAYIYPSFNQISYSTDLCYITLRHKKFSLTSL